MRSLPKISIGVPVYNGLPYVGELMDSLLSQTFGDFDIVISDNASNDGTEELLRAYATADARVKYFRNETNIGLIPNYNRVFELATAPYFKWSAADDLYEPEYLAACFPAIRDDASVAVSHSETALVDRDGLALPYDSNLHACVDAQNGRTWLLDRDDCACSGSRTRRFRAVLAKQIMCAPIYGLMRRETLLKTVLHQSFFGSDKLLLAELALHGRYSIAPGKLFKKRMHAEMTSVMGKTSVQSRIDPSIRFKSAQLVKLGHYIAMLRKTDLSAAEKSRCFAYLAVHSASSMIPETFRYRPELMFGRIPFARAARA
ncbi:glycosyl transferase [Rhodomicrobium udaipurense JA643]|uniref:Glycosyltransferase family 2 protein n=1 Tax=Rhodomicrobium udaipurense TaxID=1202716 RepID=A0A8I1GAS5_9HYPH|nr:glycosyltransferase family 2 protein [Rhodomicrobium udaipurense]KAI95219.1 glycosyl transferase [Rhodomicrobium udaipurense JA643]MBJ7542280.1 glycosyltransferase family 2 protein [Rhodomicrobium udaipurense]